VDSFTAFIMRPETCIERKY